MLQVQALKQDPELVKKKLLIKNFTDTNLVDQIIGLDDDRKKLQLSFEIGRAHV